MPLPRLHTVSRRTISRAARRTDRPTTRHPGYRADIIKRNLIEERFGWVKSVGRLRETRHRRSPLARLVLRSQRCHLQIRLPAQTDCGRESQSARDSALCSATHALTLAFRTSKQQKIPLSASMALPCRTSYRKHALFFCWRRAPKHILRMLDEVRDFRINILARLPAVSLRMAIYPRYRISIFCRWQRPFHHQAEQTDDHRLRPTACC